MKQAVILVGHGSKLARSSDAMDRVIGALRKKEPATWFQKAFLEIESPSIPQAFEQAVREGADEIIVVPYFVQTGKHVIQHVPALVSEAQAKYPTKRIGLANYLDFDDRIVSMVRDRIRQAREHSLLPLS